MSIFDFWLSLTCNLNILSSHVLKGLARNNYLEMFVLVTQSPTHSSLAPPPHSKTCCAVPENSKKVKQNIAWFEKKAGKISDSTYKMLYSSDGFSPRFYGLRKFTNREFLSDPLSLLFILRLMSFMVILREFCRLLLGILITLSKPRNLQIAATTINKFLVQRWVRPSLLSLPTW